MPSKGRTVGFRASRSVVFQTISLRDQKLTSRVLWRIPAGPSMGIYPWGFDVTLHLTTPEGVHTCSAIVFAPPTLRQRVCVTECVTASGAEILQVGVQKPDAEMNKSAKTSVNSAIRQPEASDPDGALNHSHLRHACFTLRRGCHWRHLVLMQCGVA